MRRASWLFLVPLLLAFGCRRPDVEGFLRQPPPVTVAVTMPPEVPEREAYRKEFAAALRARLATRLVVVPEGVTPPAGAAQLLVDIRDLAPSPGSPRPAVVGATTGVAVGLLSAAAGNREGAFFDGLFWGLWAGSNAAAERDRTDERLGYRPSRVRAQVRLMEPGNPEPLWVTSVDPYDVVESMDPLPPGSRDDVDRIREEEAKGFARVVVRRLSEDFHMMAVSEQRFYQPPAPKPAALEPAPEPKKD
jgi:hypothetical protein